MNSQKGSATIILLVILVIVLAGVLVYFAFLKKPSEVAISPTPTPTKTATPTPDWRIYKNNTFQMTLTDTWKGYRVKLVEMSSNFGAGTFVFELPSQKTSTGYAELIQIQILNHEYWNTIKNNDLKPIYITENKDYVFVYTVSNDYGIYFPNLKESDIQKAIASFKLIK